jgi:hypothetical protein
LLAAILADDHARVKTLLAHHPRLAQGPITRQDRFEPQIAHWVYSSDTALHVAAAGYRVEIARQLLTAGADPVAAANRRHSQPLHYAADGHLDSPAWNPRRQVSLLRLLLQAGADIDAPDQNGATPLHRAVRNRCAAAVKYLLASGSEPAIRNKPGSTPFHLAVQNTGRRGSGAENARTAQYQIIQEFLKQGVSPSLLDAKGKSVFEWAKSDWVRELLAPHVV